ncbi:hypothetical protein HK097_002128, partial [Rhizophlyctis rosea]
MAAVLDLLQRLQRENLHGPTSPYPQRHNKQHQKDLSASDQQDATWILIGDDHDIDSKDPRWFELFLEFFIEASPDTNDDLLFFVRGPPHEGQFPDPEPDPIFVKRKVNNTVPALSDVVDWKQTFFLNLIIQSPCTLTVTICKKADGGLDGKKKSLLGMGGEERVVVVPSAASGTSTESLPTDPHANPSPPLSSNETPTPPFSSQSTGSATPTSATTSTPSLATPTHSQQQKKSKMLALRRVTKKVYAAPYKSRMDVKDAFMNECSYPLVYYTVNDYESNDLHLPIREKEYLCVELSCILPLSKDAPANPVLDVPVEQDDSPFPVPEGHAKIVLFQGAVPYTSLLDVYHQKGLAAQNQLRLGIGWGAGRGNHGNTDSDNDDAALHIRTEYIMMRGPHGKGQCQVAITENISEEERDRRREEVRSRERSVPSLAERLKFLGSVVSKA